MPKLTTEEKKLQTLYKQLYGATPKKTLIIKPLSEPKIKAESLNFNSPPQIKSISQIIDESYLKKDLLKILILAAFAIGIQLSLYFGQVKKLINLNISL